MARNDEEFQRLLKNPKPMNFEAEEIIGNPTGMGTEEIDMPAEVIEASPTVDPASLPGPPAAAPAAAPSQRDLFADQQRELLNQALSEKELSDEEKIATAILSVLPGLIGGIAGGAIAGGPGAAAGAAGGLEGGARGIAGIAAEKKERRKEALGRAKDLQDRIDHIDDKLAAAQEKANDRNASMAERKAAQQHAEQLQAELIEARAKEGTLERKSRRGDILQQGFIQGKLHAMDNEADLAKARLAASIKSPKNPTEFQSKAAVLSASALNSLNDMTEIEKSFDPTSIRKLNKADPKVRDYFRALKTFKEQVLRLKTGAGMAEREAEEYVAIYEPSIFDDPSNLKQMLRQREVDAQSLLMASGELADEAKNIASSVRSPDSATNKTLKSLLGF